MLYLAPCAALVLAVLTTSPPPGQDSVPQDPVAVPVHDAQQLPNGDLLIAREDGLIVAVDPTTGEDRGEFARHVCAVFELELDPRGELLAASSADGRVALWPVTDPASGPAGAYPGRSARPGVILRPEPELWSSRGCRAAQVAWTHGGEHLLTWTSDRLQAGKSPTSVQLWTRRGEPVWTGPRASQAAASPTEQLIAAVDEDAVILYRPGGEERRLPIAGGIKTVDFSPDGTRLAVGGKDARLWIVGLADDAVTELELDHDVIFSPSLDRVRWSPDGRLLGGVLGKGLDPIVVDPETGATVWDGSFRGAQMSYIFDVAWSPDGNQVIFGFFGTSAADPRSAVERELLTGAAPLAVVPVGDDGAFVVLTRRGTTRFEASLDGSTWHRIDRRTGGGTVVDQDD